MEMTRENFKPFKPRPPEFYKETLTKLSELGLDMMVRILTEPVIDGEKVPLKHKAEIAKYVVDRKYGKAQQSVEATLSNKDDKALEIIYKIID